MLFFKQTSKTLSHSKWTFKTANMDVFKEAALGFVAKIY